VVLRGVAVPIDRLKGQRLNGREELQGAIAERLPDAMVEADRLLRALLADLSAALQYGCLEEHLECVIQHDEDGIQTGVLVRPVE